MDKEIKEVLINIKKEIDETKAFHERFNQEVTKYTNLLRADIYDSFGYSYKEEMIGENYNDNPDYYTTSFILFYPQHINEKRDRETLQYARRLNDKDWKKTPYLFWFNDGVYHLINTLTLMELLANDKEQYDLDLNYSCRVYDAYETKKLDVSIKKEDFIKLFDEANNDSKKR